MLRKTALALAIGAGLVGATTARTTAQAVVLAVPPAYVVVPRAYAEIGPPPGLGYVWLPRYHRWVYRYYYRDRDWDRYWDRDWDRDRRFARRYDRDAYDRHPWR